MATPRLGLVVEDKPTELSCNIMCVQNEPHPHVHMGELHPHFNCCWKIICICIGKYELSTIAYMYVHMFVFGSCVCVYKCMCV